MLGQSDAIHFVATVNAVAARAFYEGTLGLSFVADEPFALVFDLNGRMLRIAKVRDRNAARHTVLGWSVKDITSEVIDLRTRGVQFERFDGMTQTTMESGHRRPGRRWLGSRTPMETCSR